MIQVAFHFNVADRLEYACRLLRKGLRQGANLVATGPADALMRLDQALWTLWPTEFIAHCGPGADSSLLAASPVILTPSLAALPHSDILLNIGPAVPDGYERFHRLIEIVGRDEVDRRAARVRWKHYSDRGCLIKRHDQGNPGVEN